MRRLIAIFGIAVVSLTAYNQVPEKLSYQAVIRDVNNNLINNQSIGLRVQIIQTSVFVTQD